MRNKIFILVLVILTSAVFAEVPQMLSYQGRLADNAGNPVQDGTYQITFNIWNWENGGTLLWSSGPQNVTATNGLFSYHLGSAVLLPHSLFTDSTRWLGIKIGEDEEITPRTKLMPSPYAYHALRADTAGFAASVADQGVSNTMIMDTTIGFEKFARNNAEINSVIACTNTGSGNKAGVFWESVPIGDLIGPFEGWVDEGLIVRLSSNLDNVGIGTPTPLSKLHVMQSNSPTGLDYTGLENEDIIVEGADAVIGLYSAPDDLVGGAISLGIIDPDMGLLDKWTILRETPSGGNGLRINYGTSKNPWSNYTAIRINDYGKVGIGKNDPTARLHIGHDGSTSSFQIGNPEDTKFIVNYNGQVGIGTNHPISITTVHIKSVDISLSLPSLRSDDLIIEDDNAVLGLYSAGDPGDNTAGTIVLGQIGTDNSLQDKWSILRETHAEGSKLRFTYGTFANPVVNTTLMCIDKTGKVGINTSDPLTALTVRGNILVQSESSGETIIELGEGLDYAEGFDVSNSDRIAPGAVLIIDPENPGKLALSNKPYDSRVAGIVAGAKGLGSGVRLGAGQHDHNVALAGRVYCNVDASETGIEPGDLLTTSPIPGYAMKVTDYTQAQGAILGKAMQPMEQGQRGQILVLVTLQ